MRWSMRQNALVRGRVWWEVATVNTRTNIFGDEENKKTSEKREAFLEAFSRTGTLLAAATCTGIDRRAHYRWLDNDVDGVYAEAFQQAQARWDDRIVQTYLDRTLHGRKRSVWYRDQIVGEVTTYSDRQLARLAKQICPEYTSRKRKREHPRVRVLVGRYDENGTVVSPGHEPESASIFSERSVEAPPRDEHWSTRMKKKAFLQALRRGRSIATAAKLAGINRSTPYEWLKPRHDPYGEYREAFEEAKDALPTRVHLEVVRRALNGIRQPVFY